MDALVACGYYSPQTDLGRAALEKLVRDLTPHQRREIALKLYEDGRATVSRVADVADMPVQEPGRLLREAGLLREGSDETLAERR